MAAEKTTSKDVKAVKETIIKAASELIEENKGDMTKVTARAIAAKSGVALGLINYHFKSKDNLIEICVQRIVNKILFCFYSDNDLSDDISDRQRLINRGQRVFDFFFDNKSMTKIFILSDLKNYRPKSNTAAVQSGFKMAIRSAAADNKKKRILGFMLTSAIETAFLTGDKSVDILGYNLDIKEERDKLVEEMVDSLAI